jgi:hypothetical protein
VNITPAFLDDWRTAQLVAATGSVAAPLAVVRLWGHCQLARTSSFPDMTEAEVAGICRWASLSSATPCHAAMIEAGFLERLDGGGFAVPLFDQLNAGLLTAWKNGHFGSKGGRKPGGYHTGTTRVPAGNPAGTRRQPGGNHGGTRREPNRIEQNRTENSPGSPVPPKVPEDWGQD